MAEEEVKLIAAPLGKVAATIAPGGELVLDVLYTYPINATEAYKWVNSNDGVVSIEPSPDNKSCTVKGLKDGGAYVSVVSVSDDRTISRCLVTVKSPKVVRLTSLSLNKTSLSMHPGTTFVLKATARPSNATHRTVAWSTNDPDKKVLKITENSDGSVKVEAVGYGSASVIARTQAQRGYAVCRVTVKDLSVSSVSFSSTKRSVYLKTPNVKVFPTVSPATAANTAVTLDSSDKSVAEIDEYGMLTIHKTGRTVITATSVANARKYAKCTVTVYSRPIKSLALTGAPDAPLDVGDTATLTASAVPADADDPTVTWTSSDENIVRVADKAAGAIEAVGPGFADLTATSNSNSRVRITRRVYVRSDGDSDAMRSIWIAGAGDAVIGGESRAKHKTSPMFDRRFDDMIVNKDNMADDTTANGTALQHVKQYFEGGNVIGILNLETTLTTSSRSANKSFTFRGKPEYAKTILYDNGIDVVTLANNHTIDFGSGGYKDTQRALNTAGVKYCGSGVSYPKNLVVTANGVRVGFLGYVSKGTSASTVRSQVKALRKKCDMVVVSYHWTDVEQFYYRMPNSKQRMLARAAIDAGAKLVLGHHVHRVSGVEKYKGGYIAYDQGNFFTNAIGTTNTPSPNNPMAGKDFDSIIYRQKFNVFKDGYVEAVGVADGGIEIVPVCTTSSQKVNNTMPKPYTDPEDIRRVLSTVNRFSINFQYPISK